MDEATISQVNLQGAVSQGGGGMKKILIPLIVVLILLGAIFGGASYLRSRGESIPTPTPFPTAEPTPTEEPEPSVEVTPTTKPKATTSPTKKPVPTKEATSSATNTKGLTVRVLNGSGIAGRAAGLADYLKGLGYGIGGTGNADSEDYAKSTITIKKDKESLLPTLKSDVSTKYSVGTTSATLSSSAAYDAEVIIGKE